MTTKQNNTIFHPLEIYFCGPSGSDKTILISKLIKALPQLDIGYIKYDINSFTIDEDGKDTWKASQAGSKMTTISSQEKAASINYMNQDPLITPLSYIDMDVVFIEDYKKSLGRKILVLSTHSEEETIKRYQDKEYENIIAVVGSPQVSPIKDIPYFNRDNVEGIKQFLLDTWSSSIKRRPLHGLILGGGKSHRMGTDKGTLNYFGKDQIQHITDLLSNITNKTFVSCRSEQRNDQHIIDVDKIEDKFNGFGPAGGIVSAMHEYPEAAWLVIACDLPYLNKSTLCNLVDQRNGFKIATCYNNPEKNWPEPLCTIYEPKAVDKLGLYLINRRPCPRKVLFNSNIKKIELKTKNALDNINNAEEFNLAKEFINNTGVPLYEN